MSSCSLMSDRNEKETLVKSEENVKRSVDDVSPSKFSRFSLEEFEDMRQKVRETDWDTLGYVLLREAAMDNGKDIFPEMLIYAGKNSHLACDDISRYIISHFNQENIDIDSFSLNIANMYKQKANDLHLQMKRN